MKIAVLSRRASLYSTRRLVEAGREREHEIHVINYLRCYMDITSHKPQVMFRGEPVSGFDAVIPRVGASHAFYGASVVRQFEMMGVFSTNESQAINRAHDKLRQLQLLARAGIGLPVTGFANDVQDIDGILETVGGAPVVVKLLDGTQGKGVVLAETRKAAESVIGAFRELDANILVQEFIKESKGSDIRAFVVGDRVIAAMERHAAPGRVPLEHPPRRHGRAGQADPRGADDGEAGREDHRARRRRRRHDALQPRPRRARGQQLAGPRGHRGGDRRSTSPAR